MKIRFTRSALLGCVCFSCLFPQASTLAFNPDFGEMAHEKNSLYTSIYVYQSGTMATLQFGKRQTSTVQSQVDLAKPRVHMLEYSEMTFSSLLYNAEPKRLLVLGLGGGVIPREMRHYFPELEIDVAEIDKAIEPIASKYFGFKTDKKLKVHEVDGRVFVKRQLRLDPVPKYDIIILDAFNGDYIPFHLMTKEFLEELKGLLSDKGVVVANVFYTNQLFDAEFKTFLDVFGRCQAYYGENSGNAMLVSLAPGIPLLTNTEAVSKASEVQKKVGLSFDLVRIAGMLNTEHKPDASVKVLTDDRAPVNQLKEREAKVDKD
ncbi:MAG: fused MFS/spermidine synthase [Pontiellaceae bacterium]|nr:fused MFS/spermidine synthase [Pontiellaceae bacterium]